MGIALGLLLPFIGTTLGAATIFLMKDQINPKVQKAMLGFASGVMVMTRLIRPFLPLSNSV